MILLKFGEYKYCIETKSKSEHIIFWVGDIVVLFTKETQFIIDSYDIDLSDIDRIEIVVGGDHCQGAF